MNFSSIRTEYDELNVASVDLDTVKQVQEASANNALKRSRVCMHPANESLVHEMVIAFTKGTYIRPHKHINKVESYLILTGEIELVYFNELGEVIKRYPLTAYGKGGAFYLHAENNLWHTVLIKSDFALMLEITNGPLDATQTLFADWAPKSDNKKSAFLFLDKISN